MSFGGCPKTRKTTTSPSVEHCFDCGKQNDEMFTKQIIMGDEAWVFGYGAKVLGPIITVSRQILILICCS